MMVAVDDVAVPGGGRAYVVRPLFPMAGVLFLHWYEPPASDQNRGEFLAEAVDLAAAGVASVLPQLTFPWHADPLGDARDRTSVEAQLAAVRSAFGLLLDLPGVPIERTAVVGHDYGSMYGILLDEAPNAILMCPDATWSNWFGTYWLGGSPPGYADVFAGLDPVDHVSRPADRLYLQFADDDRFVPEETRTRLSTAAPKAKISVYERAGHFLQHPAREDRDAWLRTYLSL